MKRRQFLALLTGGAAHWPLFARAQMAATPVIGFLNSASPQPFAQLVSAFHKGLDEMGFVDGRNVRIEYRWAGGDENRLKTLAIDLVNRQVALIAATGGIRSAQIAKEVAGTIPVLFISGGDPVPLGLVSSINRPGGNATGVSLDTSELFPKRLEFLFELVPRDTKIGMLAGLGPYTPKFEAEFAQSKGLIVLRAGYGRDFDQKEFEDELALAVKEKGVRALLISADPLYYDQRNVIVGLAARHSLPAVYPSRAYVVAGGLASYGPSIGEAYRQIGIYAGRILKGAKPENLPVVLPAKWELIINIKTMKALGLTISPWLMARVHEAIE